ncbi:TlpA disulfide reductase family protein [Chitinophaga pollutisoli]|uniref:TlpA disulfide reductase family protein n=1 Tax=Chitinophaga pollutisoli TaxID=3133966 RepID=A0ABZ2YR79_9BACT
MILQATVKAPYHIYPRQASGGMGLPTEINFEENDNVSFVDEIREKGIEQKDGESLAYYAKGVTFSQTIKLKSEKPTALSFTIKYMACTKQMCLPPAKKQQTLAINYKEEEVAATDKEPEVGSGIAAKADFQYENFSMSDINGKIISASEVVNNNQYTFIDFWASWCAPCRKQGRELIPLYARYNAKGFGVIGVSLDTNDAAWKAAILSDGYTWTNLCDGKGFASPLSKKYNITSIPRNILVDRNGQIIAKDLHGQELAATIEKLLSKAVKYQPNRNASNQPNMKKNLH